MSMAPKYKQVGVRGTGRRKEAVARVRLKPGSGVIMMNGELLETYVQKRKVLERSVTGPLVTAGVERQYDVLIKAHGGGKAGQADAARMGVARALATVNPEYRKLMRDEGFLTRNSLVKERKKYGLKRARKAFQFSKR